MQILDYINKFIQILAHDQILNLHWLAYIVLALVFFIPFFISKWFKHIFFRSIAILIGLAYLEQWGQTTITKDFNFLVGIALIIPHIKYFFDLVKDTIFNIFLFFLALFIQLKNATVNTYYFFITIYYKILRLINWFIDIFIFLKALTESLSERFSSKSEQKQNYQEYSSKSEYKEEKQSYSKSEQKSNSNNERAYEDFKKSHGYNESKKEESTKQKVDEKYKQFYSSNPYEVLGVKESDDFSIIKKSYRALIRIYHPDLNPQDIELFTQIAQNLNNAYDKLEKRHKK